MINYTEYPKDWEEIRKRILIRANNCCEGSPAYPNCRAANHAPHPITKSIVFLTIAHLDHDHTNENITDERLKALCQRCHLHYDRMRHNYKKKYGANFFKTQPTIF